MSTFNTVVQSQALPEPVPSVCLQSISQEKFTSSYFKNVYSWSSCEINFFPFAEGAGIGYSNFVV